MKTQSANHLLAVNHLPPAYVDIQEEIESDLSEIDKLCELFLRDLLTCLYRDRIEEFVQEAD
jgi:hypothetical protein